MSLTLDIKPNDELAASANRAAASLERVAALESRVNDITRRTGAAARASAASQKALAEYAQKAVGAANDYGTVASKNAATDSREQKKRLSNATRESKAKKTGTDNDRRRAEALRVIRELSVGIATATAAAVGSAGALAVAIGASAKSAFESRKEATALLDAFTGRRGPEALRLLDTMASKLGESFTETRAKFVEFRQAGLNNDLSFKLIKLRSDMKAMGLSAAQADKEISRVTSAADGVGNIGARRAMAEIARAYGGIGSGAKAASLAMISLQGAQNKVGNAASQVLADLWADIGPSIGRATHRLADFGVKLLQSEDGKAAIHGISTAFKRLADAVNDESLTTGLNALRATLVAIATPFEVAGKAIGWVASKAKDGIDWMNLTPDTWLGGTGAAGGKAAADGLIKGIEARRSAVRAASKAMAADTSQPFADALGIRSPSRLFADYGRNTVEGYRIGEQRELGSDAMPLQEAAARPVESPEIIGSASRGSRGQSMVFNITVNADGKNADDIAAAVREQIQRLLSAGQLSRGDM